MTSSNQLQLEARIRRRARQIWQEEGCPDGRDDEIQLMAREQIAILDNPSRTVTNPGEEQATPTPPDPAATSTNAPRV
jgi:hypothetical protein